MGEFSSAVELITLVVVVVELLGRPALDPSLLRHHHISEF